MISERVFKFLVPSSCPTSFFFGSALIDYFRSDWLFSVPRSVDRLFLQQVHVTHVSEWDSCHFRRWSSRRPRRICIICPPNAATSFSPSWWMALFNLSSLLASSSKFVQESWKPGSSVLFGKGNGNKRWNVKLNPFLLEMFIEPCLISGLNPRKKTHT